MAVRRPPKATEPEPPGLTGFRGRARLGADGRMTLPSRLRDLLGVVGGEELEVELTVDGRLLIGRASDGRDPEQWWFWTEEWQAAEREADAEVAAGQTEFLGSSEEFIAALESRMKTH